MHHIYSHLFACASPLPFRNIFYYYILLIAMVREKKNNNNTTKTPPPTTFVRQRMATSRSQYNRHHSSGTPHQIFPEHPNIVVNFGAINRTSNWGGGGIQNSDTKCQVGCVDTECEFGGSLVVRSRVLIILENTCTNTHTNTSNAIDVIQRTRARVGL